MAETNYDTVLAKSQQFAQAAEQHAGDISRDRQDADQMADECQALDVDSQTLGELADLRDALQQAEQAMKDVMERASALPGNLAKRHGDLSEAHKNAQHPAEREFYQE